MPNELRGAGSFSDVILRTHGRRAVYSDVVWLILNSIPRWRVRRYVRYRVDTYLPKLINLFIYDIY